MGLRGRSIVTTPSLFFVTTTLIDWMPLFENPAIRDQIEEIMFRFIPGYTDAIMGYVIMPSHVHLMVGSKSGGNQLSRFMQAFKSTVSRDLFPSVPSIWMRRFDDFVITSERQFIVKLEYIHNNPVKAGLADQAMDWKWSSARFWLQDEPNDKLCKSWNWME